MQIPMALPGVLPPDAKGQPGAYNALLAAGAADLQRMGISTGTRSRKRTSGRTRTRTQASQPGASASRMPAQTRALQSKLAVLAGPRTRV